MLFLPQLYPELDYQSCFFVLFMCKFEIVVHFCKKVVTKG